MPTFQYVARDKAGKKVTGNLAGMDERAIREQLRRKDLFVTTIAVQKQSQSGKSGLFGRKKKVKLGDMVIMSRQLATLVRAGLPLVESIQVLASQTENATLKQTLVDVRADVLAGSTFTQAVGKHPTIFSDLYQALAN